MLYQAGPASMFASVARETRRYVYHRDFPADCWNVFRVVRGREEFVRSFERVEDAQAFCAEMEAEDVPTN